MDHKSFTELLVLLNEMLSDANTLLARNYKAKKILCLMGLEYKSIHACRMISYCTRKNLKV